MSIRKVYLRFDADNITGAGHLVRCQSLGRAAETAGCQVHWISKHLSPELAASLSAKTGSLLKIDSRLSWREEIAWLDEHVSFEDATIVLDVTTPYALNHIKDFTEFLDRLNDRCRVVLIDGIGEDALLGRISERPHIAVVPYVGAAIPEGDTANDCRWLLGPRYFVLQPEYLDAESTTDDISKEARRVLITFGGTDPRGTTLMALDAVAGVQAPGLEIHTVIGPGFSDALKRAIREKSKALGQECILEEAPDTLAGLISWCDVAISASGSTKYELAALGTPSIQISLNNTHAAVGEPFAATGATMHLGVVSDITARELCEALEKLLESLTIRERMRAACRQLVDGRGTNRVVAAIRNIT